MEQQATALYLIPVPIGNLEDVTLRALRLLQEVDVVLAEDTRTTGQLLKLLNLKARSLASYHMHNEHAAAQALVQRMAAGSTMALVSDAGTPAISDPGFLLVRACLQAGLRVECLPGPTAFVPALAKSGLPTDRFTFEGFLPLKKGRQTRLKELAEEPRTMVLYESPHRVLKTLQQLVEVLGPQRQASVSRELSKKFEETVAGPLATLVQHFEVQEPKGEFVLVIAGKGYEQ